MESLDEAKKKFTKWKNRLESKGLGVNNVGQTIWLWSTAWVRDLCGYWKVALCNVKEEGW